MRQTYFLVVVYDSFHVAVDILLRHSPHLDRRDKVTVGIFIFKLANQDGRSAVWMAADAGHLAAVKRLVEAKASLDCPVVCQRLLHCALPYPGSDPPPPPLKGSDSLLHLSVAKSLDLVEFLLANGMPVSVTNKVPTHLFSD